MHNERVVAWAPLRRVNRGGRGRVKRIGRQPVDGFRRDDDELSRAQQRGGGVQRGLVARRPLYFKLFCLQNPISNRTLGQAESFTLPRPI